MDDRGKFKDELSREGKLYLALVAHILTFLVRKIQGLREYRRLAREFRPAFNIAEVDREVKVPWSVEPWFTGPEVTSYVARSRNTVVGVVHLQRFPSGAFPYGYWLQNLRVWHPWRRMGLGTDLVQRVIDRAREENAPELFCIVMDTNLTALELYKRLGFRRACFPPFEKSEEQEKRDYGSRRFLLRKVMG
jgi:ribosomal protein S18 acetylase RimI-like enzyme